MNDSSLEMPLLVVKIGGSRGVDGERVLDDVARKIRDGQKILVVHGGSDETDRLATALGKPPEFVTSPSGHTSRRTDRTMVEIFATATAGWNRRLVEGLRLRGVPAFGLSGLDGGVVTARRKESIRIVDAGRQRILRDEWTGTPESVDGALLQVLLDRGLVPVVAPLASSPTGEMLNVDADRVAAAIAIRLRARALVLLTNVPGLLRDVTDVATLVTFAAREELSALESHATGRMRKKLLGAAEALDGGVPTVVLADGRLDAPIAAALEGRGTVLGRPYTEADPSVADSLAIETRRGSGSYRHRDVTLVRGDGCRVFDATGREYLDASSMYGVASLGHAHPSIVRAVSRQSSRLVSCFSTFANDVRARLLDRLAALFPPYDRFFLCNSGAEAVESALKVARFATGRRKIVAATRSFHGRTLGALSVTHRATHRDPFGPMIDGVTFVSLDDPSSVESAIDETTAAVIFEPIQGEGGVHEIPVPTLQALRARASAMGALLIADEVQTGCGRTGEWLATSASGVTADLVALAKGLGGGVPIGALLMAPSIPSLPVGSHGSTFGGNPLACAAAEATLAALEASKTLEHVRRAGGRMFERLRQLDPRCVRDVRGRGFLIGVECRFRVAPLLHVLQDRGVLTLSAGSTVLRLLPPLIMTESELDRVADVLAEAMPTVAATAARGAEA